MDVPELDVPPLPAGCEALWLIFLELHSRRGSGGMVPLAISTTDILSFQTLNDIELNPWELDCLFALDREALKAFAKSQPKPETSS